MARDPLNEGWLRKWLTGEPHFVIGPAEEPYLLRRYVIPRNRFANVYLHKFMRSDDDRALHDHPWYWCSIVLKGGYWEHRPDKLINAQSWRRAGTVAFRPPEALHRVELERDTRYPYTDDYYNRISEKPCWTLFITGPKRREWGFQCRKAWVPWQEFTSASSPGEIGRGCGEYE